MGLESDNVIRLGERLLDGGGVAGLPLVSDIVALVFLVGADDRRIGLEALHRIDDHRQRVIVDLHGIGSVPGDVRIGRNDRRHLLSLEAHLVRRQDRLGVTGHRRHPRQVVLGEQLGGHHGDHAVDRLGLGRVDPVDRGVCPRAAHERHVQHPGEHDVVDVVARTLDEPVILVALHTVADAADLG